MPSRNAAAGPTLGKTVEFDGVTLRLSTPDKTDQTWIGQDAVLRQLLACWLVVDARDLPLSPRLTGPPGIGKTTLAMAAARLRKQPLYHQPVHGRHPSGGPGGHTGARRERQDRVPRVPARHGDDRRRSLRARRGKSDEREVVGEPCAIARSSPVRREHRRWHHNPGARRFPRVRDDERG